MGIKYLSKVINEHAPGVRKMIKLSDLCGWKVAADISIYLNKFIKSDPQGWIDRFVSLFSIFKKYGIKLIGVFDGPGAPVEKYKEQEKRRSGAHKKQQKITDAQYLLQRIEEEGVIDLETKDEVRNIVGKRRAAVEEIDYEDIDQVRIGLKMAINRHTKQNAPILKEHSLAVEEIMKAMNVMIIKAEGEAEQVCSWLCKTGQVDAVLSADTDVLAYGCPIMLDELDTYNSVVRITNIDDVLEGMDLTYERFRDLCILLRCDYNKDVTIWYLDPNKKGKRGEPPKPVKVGAKKAVELIYSYGDLDNLAPHITNVEEMLYPRCREIFTLPEEMYPERITYAPKLDVVLLKNVLTKHKSSVSVESILKSYKSTPVVFQ